MKLVILVLSLLGLLACSSKPPAAGTLLTTVGDVYAVHAAVSVGQREVQGQLRLSDGDTITTGPEGRARVRLDDATLVAVDANTTFSLRGESLELQHGRIFVQSAKAARTRVMLGGTTTALAASTAAFHSRDGNNRIYCAQGELLITGLGAQARVASGETATLEQAKVTVAPEKAFDDWTGGLAVPWGSGAAAAGSTPGASAVGEKSAIPEVRALNGAADPGAPLVIRAHHVAVKIDGEVAFTQSRTTYFNGGAGGAQAQVRLALPAGAILRKVTRRVGESQQDASVGIAAGPARTDRGSWTGIEWAGGGWLSGDLGAVSAGETLELELQYVEWLTTRSGRSAYRYPMAGSDDAPLVSELSIEVNTTGASAALLSVSGGATLSDKQVTYRQADIRPSADLVVEWAAAAARGRTVRAYVADAGEGEDPYVMLRTEVPERTEHGITLALVVDASMSIGPGTLETTRAVMDALLEGLGPSDSVVVLAADQSVRPLGSATPAPVTPQLRSELQKSLSKLRAGGASNLGLALQRAADVLDAPSRGDQAGRGIVVYIGDGRPSVGEPDAASLRRLLGQRAGGMPRLGAIAVGAGADRWALAQLIAGVGHMYDVADRADAARAGAALLAEALQPTLRDVQLDPGTNIDRIYPREARAVLSGSTLTVLGRLRGKLPEQMAFSFRDGALTTQETWPVLPVVLPAAADVAQRWATARVEEMAARDEGIEPAIAIAAEFELLTPWTSWFFSGPAANTSSRPFKERVLDLSPLHDTPFAARIDDLRLSGSTLLEPPSNYDGGVSLEEAVEMAIRRILRRAGTAVRACRDARASVRQDLGRSFELSVSIDKDGVASKVRVVIADPGATRDAVLERCIAGVVKSLPYFATGVSVNVSETLHIPDGRTSQRTQCSAASKISLPLRQSLWRARVPLNADAYLTAARSCELPRWTDRRAFLLLLLEASPLGSTRLQLASELEDAGESDAASFIRKETLRRVTHFEELEALSRQLIADEPNINDELGKAYKKAKTNEDRLEVVRRFLRLAPHSPLARRRLLALLEELGMKEALVAELETLRNEPLVDAGLLAQGASALRRIGQDEAGRRVFGELIERAPRDPWTLAYVGDRLRGEGLFDEACTVYENLERALPSDAAVTLRLALAHAGAGRLDVATRLLERVTQTGGRGDDGRVGELSSITQAVLLAGARGGKDPAVEAELQRRLLQTPLPDVQSLLLVQSAPADDPIEVSVVRERGEKQAQSADLDARSVGVAAIRVERGDGATQIRLTRSSNAGPSRPTRATVFALVLEEARAPQLLKREVEVSADGEGVELLFTGEAFL